MRLDKLVLGFLVFSFIVWSSLFVFTDINTNYDLDIELAEFNSTYNKINETYDLSQNIREDVIDGDIEGADQSWDSMVKNSYSAIRLVSNTIGFFTSLVEDVARAIKIPTPIVYFAITALTIMTLFGIIFLVFRSKG